MFFPEWPPDPSSVTRALAICDRCEVREECLGLALTHSTRDDAGIWGGTTEAERDRLRHVAGERVVWS